MRRRHAIRRSTGRSAPDSQSHLATAEPHVSKWARQVRMPGLKRLLEQVKPEFSYDLSDRPKPGACAGQSHGREVVAGDERATATRLVSVTCDDKGTTQLLTGSLANNLHIQPVRGGRSLLRPFVLACSAGMPRWLLFTLLIAPALAQDPGITAVWAVNDGEKIARDDLNSPNKRENSAWDGTRVRLFGARNEVIAFQLIVETGDRGVDALRVALPSLAHQSGQASIAYQPPGEDPSQSLDRPIQLFSENYMYVPAPATASWIYRAGSPSAPLNIVGWKPVQLVPENARPGRGGFPLRIGPRQNQAFWIEIYARKGLPAGRYEGEIQVSAAAGETRVPVTLELFDFTLPDRNSLDAMFYYESAQPQLYQGRNLDAVYHRFAHRHRVELAHAYTEAAALAARDRFDGQAFTAAAGYQGPGEATGDRILPVTFYDPGSDFDSRPSAWSRSDAWMTFLRQFLPRGITFLYLPDEPSPSEYDRIRAIAANIHTNPGPGRALPLFITKQWTAELDGAIDIWCAPPESFSIERAAIERAKGRRYWTYNGGRPFAPAIVIEAPATDPRAMIWACFKHGIEVYFYWHTDHWQHNSQKPSNRIQNVWGNPITFDNRDANGSGSFAYGDGVLLYPGTDLMFPDQDRGIAGPISTIQLANFRRGLQDHLYLTLARSLGLAATVDETVAAIVPKVFSDTAADAPVGFAQTGTAFETARYRLGADIAAALLRARRHKIPLPKPRRPR